VEQYGQTTVGKPRRGSPLLWVCAGTPSRTLTPKNDDVSALYPNFYDPAQAPVVNSAGQIVPNTGNLLNGIGLAGKNGIPSGLVDNHWALFEPRVGIAMAAFR